MRIPAKFFVTAAPAALLALGAFPTAAWADPTAECNIPDPLAPTSTECGVNSSVFDVAAARVAVDATAVGGDSEAFGDASTAVGYSSAARGANSTAIGANSSAAQDTSTAIGANAVVLKDVPAGALATGIPAVIRSRDAV